MGKSRNTALLVSVFLLFGLLTGCATRLADPKGVKSSLVIGKVVINNQHPGTNFTLRIGRIEAGIEVDIKSKFGKQLIKVTTGPGGYFMVPNIPSNTYYLSKVSFRGGTPSGGAQDAAYVTLRKFFFTPAPGKIKHLGTRILNISKDFRITSTYRTPNREETKSYLSETYPGSPWLAREFVEKEVQSTAGEYNIKLGDAYRKLGREFTKERNLSQAIEYFKKALQANPDFPAAYNDLGNAYRRRGWEDTRSYGDAMAAYQKALEIDPNYDLAQANLGRLYRMMGKYEESISELEKAVKLNPSRAYTHDQLCLTLKFMGKMAEAVEACKRAIAVNPNFKSAYMNLATVYRATGRLEDAISALQEILEIDPNYLSAHEQLVAIYLRQGKTDKAEEHSNIVKELRKLPHR